MKHPLEPIAPGAQQATRALDAGHRPFDFSGPWFDSRTAAAYIPCASIKAWYMWRRRHGIIARNNGSVAKADLDRALKARKPRRAMSAASLANLQLRHTKQSATPTASRSTSFGEA